MTHRKLAFYVIAALPLFAATAMTPPEAPHHEYRPTQVARTVDVDNDGFVSDGEHGAWAATVLHSMDRNNDGRLTRHEYMSEQMGSKPLPGWSHWKMSLSQTAKSDAFQAMDVDHNGEVSSAEFFAELDKQFRALDRNKDGRISIEEFREWHRGW